MKLLAAEVAADLGNAGLVHASLGRPGTAFDGVCTDTRQDPAGKLFIALQGEHFDAHDFVSQALAAGARGVVVAADRAAGVPPGDHAVFAVPDTLVALQQLAKASLARHRPQVIVITGSNGKTTTKDLTVAALGALGRVHGTRGNLNNHIGVPLTVLARHGDEDFLVVEAGANDFGELDLLSRLLSPDIAVITNIGRAHLERFGSAAGVLRAKAEILNGLSPGGHAVLNADDPTFPELSARAGAARVVSFGFAPSADFRLESQRVLEAESQEITLRGVHCTVPRPGRGNALNAAAALAVAGTLVPGELRAAAAAIATARFTAQRSAWTRAGDILVLDDTYNANPDSMAQALDMLAAQPGRRIAVLGDMLELGPDAAALHAEVGRHAAALQVAHLLVVGPGMAHAAAAASEALGSRARHFADLEALLVELQALLRPGDAVLVKGSRGSRMERVVAALAAGVV